MQRFALAAVLALAWPAVAAASPAPLLTLKAPGATSFGHRIEFDGRVSPSRPGARVRLYSGGAFVTSGAVRGDGTFRIPVRVARPGPYQVRLPGASSPKVTVQIRARLSATIAGDRVAGGALRLVARLTPQSAGKLRVHVRVGGVERLVRLLPGQTTLPLAGLAAGPLQVEVEPVARPGYAAPTRTLRLELSRPTLASGSVGPAVAALAARLRELHYPFPLEATTVYGPGLADAVIAFQNVRGLPRTGVVDEATWRALDRPLVPQPRYAGPADHVEIDKTRQVLLVVRGGEAAQIVHVSTGKPGYATPEGRFAIFRRVVGFDPSPLGVLFDPMYFTGGFAIHGNPSVPTYPASHGCVRTPMWIAPLLFDSEPNGESVYVYH